MREFRLLRADEIECRVAQVDKQSRFLKLLLYKTARTDAAILDEKFGIFGWQNEYRVIDGKMYCGIGVLDPHRDEWIWKFNCGTESNMEGEKGQASDSMKRSGFTWGIGTELYSAPDITVWAGEAAKIENGKCFDRFRVDFIDYDDHEKISALRIVNCKSGKTAYELAAKPKKPAPKKEAPAPGEQKFLCDSCGAEIGPQPGKNGATLTPARWVAGTRKKFGCCLCADCIRKTKEEDYA